MDGPEPAPRPCPRPASLAFFRKSQRVAVRHVLLRGGLLAALGSVVVANALRLHGAPPAQWLLPLGLLLTALGPGSALAGTMHLLSDETWLELREDAIVYALHRSREIVVPWASVARVRLAPDKRSVHVDRSDGQPPLVIDTPLMDLDLPALAARLEADARRAAMGLLRKAD